MINIQGENWICEGETTVLTAAAGFSEYYWSNGEKGRSITVGPGSYKVVGRTEDGCVGAAEFSVGEIKLPHSFGLKILGSGRVEGGQWIENRYTVYPYNEHLEYSWMLDGDTVSHGGVVEVGALPVAAYQLRVTAFSPCNGQSASTFILLQPHEGELDSTTVYTCASEAPYYYFSVPFSEPGVYDIVSVNQVGLQVAVRRYLEVEPQYSESYDTVALCRAPVSYQGTAISQPGSYDIPIQSFFGCQELVHLEVLEPLAQAQSLQTIANCGGGSFEYEGELYTMPGLYEKAYPTPHGCDSMAYTFVDFIYELPASEIYAEICSGETFQHDGLTYSEEGAYTRVYPLANGCDSTVTIQLVHRESPTEEAHHYFCNEGSIEVNGVVFTESGMLEYWVPGPGEACDSLIMAHIWELEPIEAVDQLLSPDDGGGNGAIELFVQGGRPPYAYEWSNGATTKDISGLAAGIYMLTVTDEAGCSGSFTFELGLLSGSSPRGQGRPLSLGPNPFREELHLFGQAGLQSAGLKLYLYDAGGRLALSLPFPAQGAALPPGLPSGLYWYRLERSGELLSAGKIVRE